MDGGRLTIAEGEEQSQRLGRRRGGDVPTYLEISITTAKMMIAQVDAASPQMIAAHIQPGRRSALAFNSSATGGASATSAVNIPGDLGS